MAVICGNKPLTEPRPRRDGKCVVCKKERPMFPEGDKRAKIYRVDLDPFCSTQCCKKYYGVGDHVVEDEPTTREKKERGNGYRHPSLRMSKRVPG